MGSPGEATIARKRKKSHKNRSQKKSKNRVRKKPGEKFCGTHIKGTPHGEITAGEQVVDTTMKIEVWAQDIKGIIYFIDKTGNVYDPQHVHQNLKNPNIIAKWKKDSQGNYTIPDIF